MEKLDLFHFHQKLIMLFKDKVWSFLKINYANEWGVVMFNNLIRSLDFHWDKVTLNTDHNR